jgi:hypothetical protein
MMKSHNFTFLSYPERWMLDEPVNKKHENERFEGSINTERKGYMNKVTIALLLVVLIWACDLRGQTVIPNAGFENWTSFGSYSDPTGWDTPNEELMMIPFIGITVVSKSTDHHGTGSFSAKLETKHFTLPPLDIPGFMTCGKLIINLASGTFVLSGGVPVVDQPTHLKGFFKYIPKGGDSCVIGIGLTKTSGTTIDTVGLGSFSTKDTITDWTPFSAWINYISAMSTAQETKTIGTILYVDDLYLDYTVGSSAKDPDAGINVYNDRETRRLMMFFDFASTENTRVRLYDMIGRNCARVDPCPVKAGRKVIAYESMRPGIYVLEITHDNQIYTKKFFLNQ